MTKLFRASSFEFDSSFEFRISNFLQSLTLTLSQRERGQERLTFEDAQRILQTQGARDLFPEMLYHELDRVGHPRTPRAYAVGVACNEGNPPASQPFDCCRRRARAEGAE